MEDSCDLLGLLYSVFITFTCIIYTQVHFEGQFSLCRLCSYQLLSTCDIVIMIEVNMRIRCSQKQVYIMNTAVLLYSRMV